MREAAAANASLLAARETLSSSLQQERGSYSGFFPQVTGTLSANQGSASTASGGGGVVVGGAGRRTYTASVTATQNLFSGLSDRARVMQAGANVEVSDAELAVARAKASADLKSAFAGLLQAEQSAQLTEDIARRRESNLKLVTLRYESGRENKGSLQLSRAYLEQARYEALQARYSVDVARADLARVLGREREAADELAVRGEVPMTAPPRDPDFRGLALQTPEYARAAAREAAASAGVTSARSGFLPSLGLTFTESRNGTEFFPGDRRWTLGAQLSVPLFSGGKDYYSLKGALDTKRAADHAREEELRTGVTRLKQAYRDYALAAQRLEADRAFVEAASTRERIAREKYNTGLLSFEDWDGIETDLINRQKALLQSTRERVTAEAAWEQAQGKGVFQ